MPRWKAKQEGPNALLVTLRRKVLQDGKDLLRVAELRKYAKWTVANENDKWTFAATFLNEFGDCPSLDIKLYFPCEEDAELAQSRFLKEPAKMLADAISAAI